MLMLRAIADGEDDPIKLAGMARNIYKKNRAELELALEGYISFYQE
ncbi:hypothetical protein ACFSCX_09775 [Bacillus salitolerans]|uniref:Uncharacterized protein n=1 Tax=Bacillus salitolerans TaxID=1437434 RepID=A0ABW4LQ87_9BACI